MPKRDFEKLNEKSTHVVVKKEPAQAPAAENASAADAKGIDEDDIPLAKRFKLESGIAKPVAADAAHPTIVDGKAIHTAQTDSKNNLQQLAQMEPHSLDAVCNALKGTHSLHIQKTLTTHPEFKAACEDKAASIERCYHIFVMVSELGSPRCLEMLAKNKRLLEHLRKIPIAQQTKHLDVILEAHATSSRDFSMFLKNMDVNLLQQKRAEILDERDKLPSANKKHQATTKADTLRNIIAEAMGAPPPDNTLADAFKALKKTRGPKVTQIIEKDILPNADFKACCEGKKGKEEVIQLFRTILDVQRGGGKLLAELLKNPHFLEYLKNYSLAEQEVFIRGILVIKLKSINLKSVSEICVTLLEVLDVTVLIKIQKELTVQKAQHRGHTKEHEYITKQITVVNQAIGLRKFTSTPAALTPSALDSDGNMPLALRLTSADNKMANATLADFQEKLKNLASADPAHIAHLASKLIKHPEFKVCCSKDETTTKSIALFHQLIKIGANGITVLLKLLTSHPELQSYLQNQNEDKLIELFHQLWKLLLLSDGRFRHDADFRDWMKQMITAVYRGKVRPIIEAEYIKLFADEHTNRYYLFMLKSIPIASSLDMVCAALKDKHATTVQSTLEFHPEFKAVCEDKVASIERCYRVFQMISELGSAICLEMLGKNQRLAEYFGELPIEEQEKYCDLLLEANSTAGFENRDLSMFLQNMDFRLLNKKRTEILANRENLPKRSTERRRASDKVNIIKNIIEEIYGTPASSEALADAFKFLKSTHGSKFTAIIEREILPNAEFKAYCAGKKNEKEVLQLFKTILDVRNGGKRLLTELLKNPDFLRYVQKCSLAEQEVFAKGVLAINLGKRERSNKACVAVLSGIDVTILNKIRIEYLNKKENGKHSVSTIATYANIQLEAINEAIGSRKPASLPAAQAAPRAVISPPQKPAAAAAAAQSTSKIVQKLQIKNPAILKAIEIARQRAIRDAFRCVNMPDEKGEHFTDARESHEDKFSYYIDAYKVAFAEQKNKINTAQQEKKLRYAKNLRYQHYRNIFENFPEEVLFPDDKDFAKDLENIRGVKYVAGCNKYQMHRDKIALVPDANGTGQWKVIALVDFDFPKDSTDEQRIFCEYTGENCNDEKYQENPDSVHYLLRTVNKLVDASVQGNEGGFFNHFNRPNCKFWASPEGIPYVVARKGMKIRAGDQLGSWYQRQPENAKNITRKDGLCVRKTPRPAAAAAAAVDDSLDVVMHRVALVR